MKRWSILATLLAAVVGCGDGPHPTAVLTSAHFTLYAYGDAPATDTTLDWLEADYRDTRAYLGFPENHVEYHLFPTASESGSACYPGSADPITGCARGSTVYTNLALDHHELLHAYMAGVGRPPPLFREGVAQGVSCSPAPPSAEPPLPPWRTTVTLPAADQPDVYAAGLAMFVYLVNTYGVDRFVAYYGAAHDTSSPDLFQQEFEAFWGTSLDTVWDEMQVPQRPGGAIYALCPCTQPPLPLDGTPVDPAAIDTSVLPLPASERGPYLFAASATSPLRLMKCAQDLPPYHVAGPPNRPEGMTVARLLPEPYYIALDPSASLAAQRGNFVAPTCTAAQPVTIPASYLGTAEVLVVRAAGDPADSEWYARFAPTDTRSVRVKAPVTSTLTLELCTSCDAAASPCVTLASGDPEVTLTLSGPELVVHVRAAGQAPDVVAPATFVFLDPP